MWRTLLSPIVEAVSPERRAGGAGCYITPLRRLRKPEELAAIHTTDSLPADTRSISHFTFVNRDHDDPQHHCASRPLPGAVPACRGPAAPPDPAVRLPDPLQLSGGGPAADKPPRRLLKSDCPVSEWLDAHRHHHRVLQWRAHGARDGYNYSDARIVLSKNVYAEQRPNFSQVWSERHPRTFTKDR